MGSIIIGAYRQQFRSRDLAIVATLGGPCLSNPIVRWARASTANDRQDCGPVARRRSRASLGSLARMRANDDAAKITSEHAIYDSVQPSFRRCAHCRRRSRHQLNAAPAVCEKRPACRHQQPGIPTRRSLRLSRSSTARRYACDATIRWQVAQLFDNVVLDNRDARLGPRTTSWPGSRICRKTSSKPPLAIGFERTRSQLRAFQARFWSVTVQRDSSRNQPTPKKTSAKGTIIFTNASAAPRVFRPRRLCNGIIHSGETRARACTRTDAAGYPRRHVPIDAAIGWTRRTNSRATRLRERLSTQHGRPRPYRRTLSALQPPASLEHGRSKSAPAVGREMVTRRRFSAKRVPVRRVASSL